MEDVMGLAEAARRAGVTTQCACDWCYKGVKVDGKRIRLKARRVGKRVTVTTQRALRRFLKLIGRPAPAKVSKLTVA
jgi:hypothetical protein